MAICKYCGHWFAASSGYKKNYCCQACYEKSDEKRQEVARFKLYNRLLWEDGFISIVGRSIWFSIAWFCLFGIIGIYGVLIHQGMDDIIYLVILYGISLLQSILMIHKRKAIRRLIVLGIPAVIIIVFFIVYGIPFLS